MKRRMLLIISILSLFVSGLSAYEFVMTPWQGGFSLDMATNDYDFVDNSNISYEINSKGSDVADRTQYSDKEMIGLIGVQNIYAHTGDYDPNQPLIISASCPGGFYFTSRSNPDAKRPFEILVVPSYSWSYNQNAYSEWNKTVRGNVIRLGDTSAEVDQVEYPGGENQPPVAWGNDGDYRYIWCDLVICLPFDSVSSTGVLEADGTYNLIEATDYSAVVTITITYNGESQSLTIPLSGYYSRNHEERDDSASLSIRSLPRAMNLNIGGNRRMDRVADIDFMANQTSYVISNGSLIVSENLDLPSEFHIFLSASNDAKNPEGRGFELVHSSVKYTDPHTQYNSIGYTARLIDDETGQYMDFDGTDAIDSITGVIPGFELEQKVRKGLNQKEVFYQEFHGGIEVLIDEITATGDQEGINKMLAGQYTSTIYVHVVGE